jgi:hypothetical protein
MFNIPYSGKARIITYSEKLYKLQYIIFVVFYPFIRLANKISWRVGRPYKCRDIRLERIKRRLRPGMVILTHKDYEFTNLFILGYWTHSAIVISEENVVEAVSDGVIVKNIESFLTTVDDFIVLKPKFCNFISMRMASDQVKKFVGLPYNFTFKPSRKSIYCSELIYKAYSEVPEWNIINKEAAAEIPDFNSGKIIHPQSIFRSRQLWKKVRIKKHKT